MPLNQAIVKIERFMNYIFPIYFVLSGFFSLNNNR